MFSFLFDGKLGEMLAPVLPSNQLYLAIQNHRNSEVQSLISSQQFDLRKPSEAGYMAIHVACRYNNVGALDMIVLQGIPIDQADNHGNTTLHYAAKAGHLELCKLLIDRGCSPAKKNNMNQSPYDATENHLVRQYLLPLIFKYESGQVNANISQQETNYGMRMSDQEQPQTNMSYESAMGSSQIPESTNQMIHSYIPPSAPIPPVYPPAYLPPQNIVPLENVSDNSAYATYAPPPTMSYTAPPPPPVFNMNANITPTMSGQGNMRKIKAASDPELKAKYGHIKPEINIAPPPTALSASNTNGNQYSAFGNSSVYSRYPVYDPISNSSAPPTALQTNYAAPSGANVSYSSSIYSTSFRQSPQKMIEEEVLADSSSNSVL